MMFPGNDVFTVGRLCTWNCNQCSCKQSSSIQDGHKYVIFLWISQVLEFSICYIPNTFIIIRCVQQREQYKEEKYAP